jgi:hypothetical protein
LKALVWVLGASGLGVAVAGAIVAGCSQKGDAASPGPFAEDATVDAGGDDSGDDVVFYAVCPQDIDATFGSVEANLLNNAGCISTCHVSGTPASKNGNLVFELEASDIYAELLGDGGGMPAFNEAGSARILRVAPFDPDASLLYIKLNLHYSTDPLYGSGMPWGTPGSVCPAAIEAVGQWIAQGAPYAPHD